MQTYKNRRSITTVNNHLPFVWRVNSTKRPRRSCQRSRTKTPAKFCRRTFLGRVADIGLDNLRNQNSEN